MVVEVPASSANLGAGYDALAVALELTNRVEVEAAREPGFRLEVEGEGADVLETTRDNRLLMGLEAGMRAAGGPPSADAGWLVRMRNEIPLRRGLGSSAAATVAGLVAGAALAGRSPDLAEVLRVAAGVEGHADNAAAALHGGFVVVATVDGSPEVIRFEPPAGLGAVLFVPDLELATDEMRAVLPGEVPHRDAAFNVGRAALGVAAIATGRSDLLSIATEDRLHEPYRAALFPALPRLTRAARDAGALGACLSGAGSAVIAFVDADDRAAAVREAFEAAAAEMNLAGRARAVALRRAGATVLEAE